MVKATSNSKRNQNKSRSPYRKMDWEIKFLEQILLENEGEPFNITDISKKLEISQPILWRITNELISTQSIIEYKGKDVDRKSLGPEKKFYIPTIDSLFEASYMELTKDVRKQREHGITLDEIQFDPQKNHYLKNFKYILESWWPNDLFRFSIFDRKKLKSLLGDDGDFWDHTFPSIIDPKYKSDKELCFDKLKTGAEYLCRVRLNYLKVKNRLSPFYENLIGSHQLALNDPDYNDEKRQELYDFFTPFTLSIDAADKSHKEEMDYLRNRIHENDEDTAQAISHYSNQNLTIPELEDLKSQIESKISERKRLKE